MGMTEVLRPSLYGSQHPLVSVGADGELPSTQAEYVVVGHCCESGDLLTPAPDEPETIAERLMGDVSIGDYVVIEGSGAYCAGMSSKNYNSFPEAPEVMKRRRRRLRLFAANRRSTKFSSTRSSTPREFDDASRHETKQIYIPHHPRDGTRDRASTAST